MDDDLNDENNVYTAVVVYGNLIAWDYSFWKCHIPPAILYTNTREQTVHWVFNNNNNNNDDEMQITVPYIYYKSPTRIYTRNIILVLPIY